MDPLAALLSGPRARGAFLLRAVMEPPWCLRAQDEAPLALVAMARGEAWLILEHGDPVRLRAGDVAITRGPEPYTVADHPATPPQVVIHPGQRCTTPDGADLAGAMALGVRTWGNRADGSTRMLVGVYEHPGEVGQRLLTALPTVLVIPDRGGDPLLRYLDAEIAREVPGQGVILDRLLDLLLIDVLRAWFARPEAGAPAWYRAHQDPVVGQALQLLHHNPALPWTVAMLAGKVGLSRAALARRFTDLVGEPPMSYLTGWRLALAADLLAGSDATLEAVARQVGYGSGFALSAAFTRVRGISPQQYRAKAAGDSGQVDASWRAASREAASAARA